MKKFTIILVSLLLFSAPALADENDKPPRLIGVNMGLGLPIEYADLEAVGLNLHLSFDFAQPVTNTLAVVFYLGLGGGFMGAVHPYSEYDRFYYPFKFSAGVLLETGDLRQRPFFFGAGTGLGFVDMDLILPWEIRLGRYLTDRLYVMLEVTTGISLARETLYIEPAVRVGYNFGH